MVGRCGKGETTGLQLLLCVRESGITFFYLEKVDLCPNPEINGVMEDDGVKFNIQPLRLGERMVPVQSDDF